MTATMAMSLPFVAWSGLIVVLVLVLLLFRGRVLQLLPGLWKEKMSGVDYQALPGGTMAHSTGAPSLSARLPTYAWTASRLAGLHSTLFDIEANISNGDERVGLEPVGAHAIQRLMVSEGLSFDDARLKLNRQRFAKQNIDPLTGMPLDKKAVTFENLK